MVSGAMQTFLIDVQRYMCEYDIRSKRKCFHQILVRLRSMKFKLRGGFRSIGRAQNEYLWVATFDETQDWADFSVLPIERKSPG
jgi:hypothetical protein